MMGKHFRRKKSRNYPNAVRYIVARYSGYEMSELSVVWFCYTLGNFKALVKNTSRKDGLYFEVTFDEMRKRLYIDEYRKVNHRTLRKPQNDQI